MWPRGIIEVSLYMGEGGPNVTITHDAIGQSQVTRNPLPPPDNAQTCSFGDPPSPGPSPGPGSPRSLQTCSLCSPDIFCLQVGDWHSIQMPSCCKWFLLVNFWYAEVVCPSFKTAYLIFNVQKH